MRAIRVIVVLVGLAIIRAIRSIRVIVALTVELQLRGLRGFRGSLPMAYRVPLSRVEHCAMLWGMRGELILPRLPQSRLALVNGVLSAEERSV